jgi:predicted transcriptional regulator
MKVKPTSCYLTAEEKRAVEEIAAREERAMAKIIQFAVRDFVSRYRQGAFKEPLLVSAR